MNIMPTQRKKGKLPISSRTRRTRASSAAAGSVDRQYRDAIPCNGVAAIVVTLGPPSPTNYNSTAICNGPYRSIGEMLMGVTSLRRAIGVWGVVALTLAIIQVAAATVIRAQDYVALIAAPDRTEGDRQNDKRRDALKLLTFTAPKTDWRVLDM